MGADFKDAKLGILHDKGSKFHPKEITDYPKFFGSEYFFRCTYDINLKEPLLVCSLNETIPIFVRRLIPPFSEGIRSVRKTVH